MIGRFSAPKEFSENPLRYINVNIVVVSMIDLSAEIPSMLSSITPLLSLYNIMQYI